MTITTFWTYVCIVYQIGLIIAESEIPTWNGPYANLLLENDKSTIEVAVKQFMKSWNIPGLSLAISRDSRLGYANAFGFAVRETGERMTMRHVARGASGFSKPMTSAAIHRLVDTGAISFDDKAFDLIDVPAGVEIGGKLKNVTVKHLLQHTAGGWSHPKDPLYVYINKSLSDETVLELALRELPLEFEPGTHFGYSNFGYFLLGKIIERQMFISYEQYVRTIVQSTFGMCNAFISGSNPEDRRPFEMAYYDDEDPSRPYSTNRRRNQAAGGWVSSPLDMLKFVHKLNASLYSVPEPASRPPLLRPATIRTMLTEIPLQSGWASGWMVNSTGADGDWWLPGSIPGTCALVHRSESPRLALVFMMNTSPRKQEFWDDVFALRDTLLRTITKWPNTDPELFFDCNTLFDGNITNLNHPNDSTNVFCMISHISYLLVLCSMYVASHSNEMLCTSA